MITNVGSSSLKLNVMTFRRLFMIGRKNSFFPRAFSQDITKTGFKLNRARASVHLVLAFARQMTAIGGESNSRAAAIA
ncbi:MAG: hypothetical protein M0Q93_00100 [Terrimicrobiaceae bacterium]|nr:hypothetical protein [Terrimicrobiaceae bacterium]